jgi:EmrB/QacA subfamily drug resistance transporter
MLKQNSFLEFPYFLVVGVASLGAFMTTLDVGIINVALPYLRIAFDTQLTTIAWTITIYTLTLSASIIFFGRLSDRIGRLKIFRWGVITFGIASFLCGFSSSSTQIILFRALQGIGASMIQATSVALITTLLSQSKHPRAIGTFGTVLGLGNIMGASLGGILISLLGWPWIFWINIPLCFIVLWGVSRFKCTFPKADSVIDYLGIALIAVFAISLLTSIEFLANAETRYLSAYFGILSLFAMLCFILWERFTSNPLVDFKYFLNRQMGALTLVSITFAFSLSLYLIIPPLFLQKATSMLPWQIGLMTFCGPLGYVISSHFTGKLMEKFCNKHIIISGQIMMLIGVLILSWMEKTWSIYLFGILLFSVGLGGGFIFSPNIATIMKQVPKNIQGTAGAYARMVHNFGLSLGAAIAAMLVQLSSAVDPTAFNIRGYQQVWLVGGVMTALSFIILLCVKIKGASDKEGAVTSGLME